MGALDHLTSWHAEWRSLRVVVFGLGVTGFSVADTLVELGAEVLVVASSATAERSDLVAVIGARLVVPQDAAVPAELREFDPQLVIVSPGFGLDHALVRWALEKGIPTWGDIELAWRLRDKVSPAAEWITVTGTNGKTTTVHLAEHILQTAGERAVAVGNVGVPVLDAIRDPSGFDFLVVELSSFQLHWLPREGAGSLEPLASVCLNVADDHLDWHGSREAYAEAKATVYANTRVACVYNRDVEATRRMVEEAEVQEGCRAIGFGLGAPGPSDFGVVDDLILDRAFAEDRQHSAIELSTLGELGTAGLSAPHMVANVLAACALTRAAGVSPQTMRLALSSFRVDHHRMEPVALRDDVRWVNDSKATNPHAAEAALRSYDSVVWVVGGLLKGVDIAALIEAQASRVRAAIIIGRDRDALLAAFARHAPHVPLFEVTAADTEDVMPEVVRLAARVAKQGDVVLLAPAAASMDQFIDYADRGRRFAVAVHDYLGDAGD
ncbi:MAG: UDP-N-acetylmuramoyl-L-alanine--D-glutamate ligase [Salinibacterium sp.]|nr:MAG: UDP-N-acetylmuramoyl-L-alanine--D-glutamate ligase [Salinibacterium sp.]